MALPEPSLTRQGTCCEKHSISQGVRDQQMFRAGLFRLVSGSPPHTCMGAHTHMHTRKSLSPVLSPLAWSA